MTRDDIKKTYRSNIRVDERENRGNVTKACNTCNETKTNTTHGAYEERAGEISLGQMLLLHLEGVFIIRSMTVWSRRTNLLCMLIVVLLAELRGLIVWRRHGDPSGCELADDEGSHSSETWERGAA